MNQLPFLFEKDPLVFTKPKLIPAKDVAPNGRVLYFRTYANYGEKDGIQETTERKLKPYEDNEAEMVDCGELDDYLDIEVTESGVHKLSIYVPLKFYGYIIGAHGSKRKDLESSTGAKIKIPGHGESGNIIIMANTERKVKSAADRLNIIINEVRAKYPATHFVSIPLVSDSIKRNFLAFKKQILNERNMKGVDENVFQNPEKLHLTIITMPLIDEGDIEEAANLLHLCKSEIWDNFFHNAGKLNIAMKGVEIMNDDPQNVDILYGKVQLEPHEYNASFQKFVNGIADLYSKKGIIQKRYEKVKLHVTLMNSLFRKTDGAKRETFNCERILEKYKDYYFGMAELNNIQLSIRFKTSSNNYYDAAAIVQL